MEVGEEGDYILWLQCHHQDHPCIKVGSVESQFNVSFIVRDKVTRQCPQAITFWREKRAEADSNRGPSAYQLNAFMHTPSIAFRHLPPNSVCSARRYFPIVRVYSVETMM